MNRHFAHCATFAIASLLLASAAAPVRATPPRTAAMAPVPVLHYLAARAGDTSACDDAPGAAVRPPVDPGVPELDGIAVIACRIVGMPVIHDFLDRAVAK